MLRASWSTDVSSFYYSDINLFLIDDAWCKLCNIWLLLCLSLEENIVAAITQDLSQGDS